MKSYTKAQLADAAGVSPETFRRWFYKGCTIALWAILALAIIYVVMRWRRQR